MIPYKKEEVIRTLKVEPGKEPVAAMLSNNLSSLQSAVGGFIELLGIDENVGILCNEEGKLMGLEGNRRLGNDILVGTFYVVGVSQEGDLTSLTEDQLQKYSEQFREPEVITQEEIWQATTRIFYGG